MKDYTNATLALIHYYKVHFAGFISEILENINYFFKNAWKYHYVSHLGVAWSFIFHPESKIDLQTHV